MRANPYGFSNNIMKLFKKRLSYDYLIEILKDLPSDYWFNFQIGFIKYYVHKINNDEIQLFECANKIRFVNINIKQFSDLVFGNVTTEIIFNDKYIKTD